MLPESAWLCLFSIQWRHPWRSGCEWPFLPQLGLGPRQLWKHHRGPSGRPGWRLPGSKDTARSLPETGNCWCSGPDCSSGVCYHIHFVLLLTILYFEIKNSKYVQIPWTRTLLLSLEFKAECHPLFIWSEYFCTTVSNLSLENGYQVKNKGRKSFKE